MCIIKVPCYKLWLTKGIYLAMYLIEISLLAQGMKTKIGMTEIIWWQSSWNSVHGSYDMDGCLHPIGPCGCDFLFRSPYTHWDREKWPTFSRRHFQSHFLQWNLLYFHCSPGSINNNPSLVQIMAWHQTGYKPLSEPMLACFPDANMCDSAAMSWLSVGLTNSFTEETQTSRNYQGFLLKTCSGKWGNWRKILSPAFICGMGSC